MPETPRRSSNSFSRSEKNSGKQNSGRSRTKSAKDWRTEESRSKTARPDQPGEKHRNRRRDDPRQRRALEGEVLYGRNAVIEALAGRREIHRLFLAEGIREDDRIRALVALAADLSVAIERLDRETLDHIAKTAHHQGVGLVVGDYQYTPLDEILAQQTGTILVLDHLQDPQNLGTLLRTAEATGVIGILLPHDRSVAITPAVVNSSS